jgi:IS5 family transposase
MGYQGIEKRPDANADVNWHIAMKPGKRKALDKANAIDAMVDQVEKIKASIRAKAEYPFRVIKRQFGYVKVRYRGLKKNTAQLTTLFALSNLWMMRGKLMQLQGCVRPKTGQSPERAEKPKKWRQKRRYG